MAQREQRDLTHFVEEVTGEDFLRVEDDFGDGYVRLRSAEAERRQAKHDIRSSEDIIIEVLRNARDAGAHTIYVAVSRDMNLRRICVIDDGCGVPHHMWSRIFEARVTSKLDSVHMDTWGIHGRGMALYAIAANAKAAFIADSMIDGGTSLVVETDTTVLPEKADQSAKPFFYRTENGTVTVRGPKNICRTATEFAYIDRNDVTVYLGSPVEIACTLWHFGKSVLSPSAVAFCDDPSSLPLCKRLAVAATPEEFAHIADGLGLPLSSRSARRIMDGQIAPLDSLADSVVFQLAPTATTKKTASAGEKRQGDAQVALPAIPARTLHLSDADRQELADRVAEAYRSIAPAYYLAPDVPVSVTVRKDAIHISIPVAPEP